MRHLTALIVAAVTVRARPPPRPEPVEIRPEGVKLKGFIYRPAGRRVRSRRSSRCIIATASASAGRRSRRATRDWGERLAAGGFVVLFPDSFGSRGIGAQCSAGQRSMRSGRERVGRRGRGAALAAGAELRRGGPGVADRLGQWRGRGAVDRAAAHRQARTAKPDFRSAVAFFPGCRRLRDTAWSARLPTLILIGAQGRLDARRAPASRWWPARAAAARGPSIVVYPGAYHDFDHPDLPLQQRSERGVRDRAAPAACMSEPTRRARARDARAERVAGSGSVAEACEQRCSAVRIGFPDSCTSRRNML